MENEKEVKEKEEKKIKKEMEEKRERLKLAFAPPLMKKGKRQYAVKANALKGAGKRAPKPPVEVPKPPKDPKATKALTSQQEHIARVKEIMSRSMTVRTRPIPACSISKVPSPIKVKYINDFTGKKIK